MIFDTHCHMQFDDYDNIEKELETMEKYWVKYATLIWSDYESTIKCLNLAKKYSQFLVVVWIMHPIDAPKIENFDFEINRMFDLVEKNKDIILWVWEAWYDYFHINKDNYKKEQQDQTRIFEANIELAKKYNLPLIIHNRDAWEDTYEIIKKHKVEKFVIHCYTGNYDWAMKFIDLSPEAHIWFSWIVTFKNAQNVQDTTKRIPLERILVETDAPYLAPPPFRGKLNTSWYTKFVLDKIKELRSEAPELIENQIYENSLRFYWVEN